MALTTSGLLIVQVDMSSEKGAPPLSGYQCLGELLCSLTKPQIPFSVLVSFLAYSRS